MAEEDVIEFKAESERIKKLPFGIINLVAVKGIHVVIENLHDDAKSAGLTREQLQTDVELKLRHAGIKINSFDEMSESYDKTKIYVTINTFSSDDSPGIIYHVSVRFRQLVLILRSPHHGMVCGTTWSAAEMCLVAKSKFPETARQVAKEQMDEFIKDYFKANPKK